MLHSQRLIPRSLLNRQEPEPYQDLGKETTMTLNLLNDQRGAAAVEYALLAVLIAAVVAASVIVLGNKVEQLFKSVVF